MSSRGGRKQKLHSPPPNLYKLLFLLQRATTTTVRSHFKTLLLLRHPEKGGQDYLFRIILQAKSFVQDENGRQICDEYGVEKAENYLNSKLDP